MWILVSYTLIALGAATSSVEELISHRRTRVVLSQTRTRSALTVATSVFLVVASILVIAVTWSVRSPEAPVIGGALLILATGLVVRAGIVQGLDGSDRMLLCAGIGTASWANLQPYASWLGTAAWLGLFLLLSLAYFDSGLAKVKHRGWRVGRQFALTLNMKEFGNKFVAGVLLSSPRFAALASWGVITLELAAGPLLLIGGWVTVAAGVLLAMIHLSIAVFMGLGRFFYPFVGALAFIIAAHPW